MNTLEFEKKIEAFEELVDKKLLLALYSLVKKIQDTSCFISFKKIAIPPLKNNDTVEFTINSTDKSKINFSILYWKNTVNIYLGTELLHYSDDWQIESQSDINKYEEILYMFFASHVSEKLIYNKKNKLAGYSYIFSLDQNDITYKHMPLIIGNKRVSEKKYAPWITNLPDE